MTDATTDRAAWLAERRKGIGATDIAAIAGVHPYRTAIDVYADKVLGVQVDLSGNRAVEWGIRLEDVIARKYAEAHRVELASPGLVVHPDRAWMRATPDRLVVGRPRAVECKTAGARVSGRWGESGTDRVPEEYLVQVVWQIAVLDYDDADLAVLIGGSDYREYRIARDLELEAGLVEIGERFWRDHVLARVPPELDGSDAAAAYLRERYQSDEGEMLASTPEIDALVEKYREASADIALAEIHRAEARHRLMEAIGDHEGVAGKWGKIYWRREKGRPAWKKIAEAAGATEEMIEAHTSRGRRVLRPYWHDEED